jgi:hypothetical protein
MVSQVFLEGELLQDGNSGNPERVVDAMESDPT